MRYFGFNNIDPTVAQLAEAIDLKSIKCEFESHQWDQLIRIRLKKFGYRSYIYKTFLRKRKIVDDCWLWTGASRAGYGSFKVKGRVINVHRFIVHLLFNMPLEPGKYLACHTLECKNKHCYNPNHLYRGDEFTNMQDAVKAGTHNWLAKNRK